MRQLVLDLGPIAPAGLQDYVPGANGQALAHLRDWPQSAGSAVCTYLWGEPGVGKTHLLRAMMGRGLALGWGGVWLSPLGCQTWDSGQQAGGATLVLIDDAQELDAPAQHLAFKLFVEAAAAQAAGTGLHILAAGSMPAATLPVRDDLRTRLAWGESFALQGLDDEGLALALKQQAHRRGMRLSDEVVHYVLTRQQRSLHHLMALLDRLDQLSLATHRTLTIPLLKELLSAENA